MAFGVYVHFPYCRSKCPYCDFAVHVVRDIPHRRYADAVLEELQLRAVDVEGSGPLRSIFFGGGTPSLWDPAEVARIREALVTRFSPAADLEVSLEINPDDLDLEGFRRLKDAGITRASIGVQSFDDAVLRGLGRGHTGATAREAIRAACQAGLGVVSVDLIHGGPGHTPEVAARDARLAAESGAAHVSNYGLTLDELAVEVPLARWVSEGRVEVPDADQQAELGQAARRALTSAGFERYEISNYAKGGAVSRHNLGYWSGEPYLGLGVGAFGATDGLRYGNGREVAPYLEALEHGRLPAGERDPLDASARLRERVFLGLRLTAGLSLTALETSFGPQAVAELRRAANPLVSLKLMTLEGDRLALTETGLDLHSRLPPG